MLPNNQFQKLNTNLCEIDCPHCKGYGVVRPDLPINDPDFGKLIICPNANPIALYGAQSGLSDEEYTYSWSEIININGVGNALDLIIETLTRGWGWIYIWGDYGLGKTRLLMTAVAQSIQKKLPSIYISMANILNDVRSGYSDEYSIGEAEKRLKKYCTVELLCIDEFDRIKVTPFADETRFTLLDHRYISAIRQKSITLIASNSSPEDYSGYIADRIFDGRFNIIHLQGISARPNMSI